jgi:3-oxoacyl-(acyl-carrier-protein) synthase
VATVFKPYVGHMLAASGLIETICALLAMKHDTVPATLNSRPEHVHLAVPLVTQRVEKQIRTILKLSNGFTGHDAASLFGKC